MSGLEKLLRRSAARNPHSDSALAALEKDLERTFLEFPDGCTALDVYMCYRLMLGRPPDLPLETLRQRGAYSDLRGLSYGFVQSPEFQARWQTGGMKVPEVPVMAELKNFRLWFYLSDMVVGWGAVQGTYEGDLASAILDFVKPGMLCCDLGANIGYFSLLMAHAGAEVYAFEPFPKNYALLGRNVDENRLGERIKTHQAAVMEKSGKARLFVDHNESDYVAMFVSEQPGVPPTFRQLEIETVVLDQVIPAERKVECIKMDIEGSEPLALAGMKRILERDHPRIFFEFNTGAIREHGGKDPAEVLDTLKRNGYEIVTLAGQRFEYSGGDQLENLVAI